jgi:glycosyltransferase involved in cell wall biosynthesis
LEGGGAQRVFVTLVNSLVSMSDHPIHLVTSRTGGVFENSVDERVVRVTLGPKHVSRSVFRLAAYIRHEQPVAMVSTLNYCNVIFLLSALLARVPLRKVIREANIVRAEPGPAGARLRSSLMRTLMRMTYRFADDLIIITEDVARSLAAHRIGNTSKMRRIPNPVWLDRAPRASDEQGLRRSRPFVLGIGRLSHQKGFDTLIRAFALLNTSSLDLVLLGEGPQRRELEALSETLGVRHQVVFAGFVSNPQRYLEEASLFVLSSRWEGFSNVLVEALAAGTPMFQQTAPDHQERCLRGEP